MQNEKWEEGESLLGARVAAFVTVPNVLAVSNSRTVSLSEKFVKLGYELVDIDPIINPWTIRRGSANISNASKPLL